MVQSCVMAPSQPRIAVAGGGPAGLTIGVLLHKNNVPVTIFDLRQKPTEEELAKPSGMLDLHDESGQAALKECGLFEEFLNRKAECTEAQKVADKDGNILYRDEGELSDRPEISRHALVKLLMSQLPPDTIKWGHRLLSATKSTASSGHTEIQLDFGPHGKHSFDLVIGADGAWSRVRKLLSGVTPYFASSHVVTATIRQVTKKYPHLAELVGTGSFSSLAFRHGIMSQRGPQDSARIYAFFTTDDEHFPATKGLSGKPAATAKSKLLDDDTLLGGFGPRMKELMTTACDEDTADNPGAEIDVKTMYSLPIGHSWEHQVGATLIGDAAHLMCPWAGEGVNLAMWDSLLLGKAIVKAYNSAGKDNAAFQKAADPLVKEYEVDMVARTTEKAEETYSNGQMMFAENGAERFVKFFESVMPPPE